jgi:adenylate kinase
MEKIKNFSLIGRSGCGKGTQADLLTKRFGNLHYISTGDLFRELAKKNTDTGKKIKKILEEGGLPFDDLATTLWMHEVAFNLKNNEGVLFDGAPRRLEEATDMDEFMKFLGRDKDMFYILLDISREEAYDRLIKRNRPDDNPEAINSRLDFYEERVTEVVNYFEKQNKLIKINGEQTVESIFKDILKVVK